MARDDERIGKVIFPFNIDMKNFFSDVFESRHHCYKDVYDSEALNAVLDAGHVDKLIAEGYLRRSEFDIISGGRARKLDEHIDKYGFMDSDSVYEAFQAGESLRIFSIHRKSSSIDRIRHQISNYFGCYCFVNAYLTPPAKGGFNPHYDAHDVFILQISGKKDWKIYDVGPERVVLPLRNEEFKYGQHKPGAEIDSFEMAPGDLLYIPRGRFHSAATKESEGSIHLTFGVQVVTWATVLIELMAIASKQDPDIRKGVIAQQSPDIDSALEIVKAISERWLDSDKMSNALEQTLVPDLEGGSRPIHQNLIRTLRLMQ